AAGDREHLLFSAGERVAGLLEPLLQSRKTAEHIILPRRVRLAGDADVEILLHRQRRENAAALRHVADTVARDLVRCDATEFDTVEFDRSMRAPDQSHDRA